MNSVWQVITVPVFHDEGIGLLVINAPPGGGGEEAVKRESHLEAIATIWGEKMRT